MQTQFRKSPAWMPPRTLFAALAFVCGTCVIALGAAALAPGALMAEAEADAPSARRCPECGWIESKGEIPGGTDNLAIRIETYTVRMVDGSSRVFTGGPGERWRLGERLKVIDGDVGNSRMNGNSGATP